MGSPPDWLAAGAALLAIVLSLFALRRQVAGDANAYLTLSLELVAPRPGWLIAHTRLENRSRAAKPLTTVFFLLGPCDEDPIHTFSEIVIRNGGTPVASMSDFPGALPAATGLGAHTYPPALTADDRMLVLLPYYSTENSEVADETLTFDIAFRCDHLTTGQAYGGRLLLYGPDRLHRVVHRAFIA